MSAVPQYWPPYWQPTSIGTTLAKVTVRASVVIGRVGRSSVGASGFRSSRCTSTRALATAERPVYIASSAAKYSSPCAAAPLASATASPSARSLARCPSVMIVGGDGCSAAGTK
eukprot:scaffold56386_cov68-Phaeocystis_antarctica.AAC.2